MQFWVEGSETVDKLVAKGAKLNSPRELVERLMVLDYLIGYLDASPRNVVVVKANGTLKLFRLSMTGEVPAWTVWQNAIALLTAGLLLYLLVIWRPGGKSKLAIVTGTRSA